MQVLLCSSCPNSCCQCRVSLHKDVWLHLSSAGCCWKNTRSTVQCRVWMSTFLGPAFLLINNRWWWHPVSCLWGGEQFLGTFEVISCGMGEGSTSTLLLMLIIAVASTDTLRTLVDNCCCRVINIGVLAGFKCFTYLLNMNLSNLREWRMMTVCFANTAHHERLKTKTFLEE